MTGGISMAARLADQPKEMRDRLIAELTPEEAENVLYDWRFWARPEQLPPDGDWVTWLILAGRGFGKTRTGAEWIRESARDYGRLGLVGPTAADVRDIMVEGESGIIAISPPDFKPQYEPSKRRLTWPNGSIATAYSGDEPDRLRGNQHDRAWVDEWSAFRYPQEALDMLMFTLRLGKMPRALFTQTPKPIKPLKRLMTLPTTIVVRGTTHDNLENLPGHFVDTIIRPYEGTRLGRQEIYGEILEDVEGAYWKQDDIDETRVPLGSPPDFRRVVVAVDPAGEHKPENDETGITVAAVGVDGEWYVLDSLGVRLTPAGWAAQVWRMFDTYAADRVVVEANNGGEMCEFTLRQMEGRRQAPISVIKASRGKVVRAEPVAALYERHLVHHVGTFAALEEQMCSFPVANEHDDLVDSLVYALTELGAVAEPAGAAVEPEPSFSDRRRSFAIGRR